MPSMEVDQCAPDQSKGQPHGQPHHQLGHQKTVGDTEEREAGDPTVGAQARCVKGPFKLFTNKSGPSENILELTLSLIEDIVEQWGT